MADFLHYFSAHCTLRSRRTNNKLHLIYGSGEKAKKQIYMCVLVICLCLWSTSIYVSICLVCEQHSFWDQIISPWETLYVPRTPRQETTVLNDVNVPIKGLKKQCPY